MTEVQQDATAAPAPTAHKEALCFQCALRMSILFRLPPPQSTQQLINDSTFVDARSQKGDPMIDDRHHARFSIVHETDESVQRYLVQAHNTDMIDKGTAMATPSAAAGSHRKNTSDGMLAGEIAQRFYVTWLCVACQGLYQFLDLVHAPCVAVAVRHSSFTDSAAISINVNVNRSFTFTWLAAATRYFDVKGTMTERPKPLAVIPEELCNFKEFYMSDLRARALQYLLHSHTEVAARNGAHMLGFSTYMTEMATIASEPMHSEEPSLKKTRSDNTEERSTVTSSLGATALFPRSTLALQGFSYSPNNESVVADVFCRHHPTEAFITDGHLPQQYCSNRSGLLLSYSVIYDYVLPYLETIRWMPSATHDTRLEVREAATMSTAVVHANIYLIGNYCKMMRNLSQSPWFTSGERIGTFSLQELIANPVLPFFFPEGIASVAVPSSTTSSEQQSQQRAEDPQNVNPCVIAAERVFGYGRYKFHSAGREDVDVRMLGTGRPFVLELVSPSRERFTDADLRAMEEAINENDGGSVEVSNLRRTAADITVRLARHSESKVKRYRCVVWCSRAITNPAQDPHVVAINAMKDLSITQKTPLRVLHRRSLLARPRIIHSMHLTSVNAHWFVLDVETQAGTYVKEFVHGDLGRTTPSLGMLLNARTDIIQLDVVGMALQDLDSMPVPAAASSSLQ